MIMFKTAFDGIRRTDDYGLDCGDERITEQEHKDECDINNILRKYQTTGLIEHVARYNGDYTDCIGVGDYLEAQTRIIEANEMFAGLPATVRDRFSNDTSKFLEFVQNDANRDEMIKLGLIEQPQSVSEPPVQA